MAGAYRLIAHQTLDGVGAIQGVSERGGMLDILGDAETGVIREFTLDRQGPLVARASPTSLDGVLVHTVSSGLFVQSLRWIDEPPELVLVQNREPGLLYRLPFMRLDRTSPIVVDFDGPRDESEGYQDLGNGLVLVVSAAPAGSPNATFFRIRQSGWNPH